MQDVDEFLKERRRHPRHPLEAQITVLFPEFWMAAELSKLFGWTHNVSEGGVCFSLPNRLPQQELLLHIEYLGMGAEYVQATTIQERECEQGGWQYHCHIERTLASVKPLSCLND
jgi:hypothetical protein